MRKDLRFWLGFTCIVIAIGGLIYWAILLAPVQLEPWQEVIIQLVITAIGSYGGFLIGMPYQERRIDFRVKDRYENLNSVYLGIKEVVNYLTLIESKPRISRGQEAKDLLLDYEMASRFLLGHSSQWARTLESCLGFWNEFAPDKVGDLHKKYFGDDG
ncbi:MAG: hypothetical protein OXF50_06525 [Caldilineaceae bacterium]|nr:hypothetical protein [Caldilineaceae bacterium]